MKISYNYSQAATFLDTWSLGVPCLLLSPLLIILIVYRIFYQKSRKIGVDPEGDMTTNSG